MAQVDLPFVSVIVVNYNGKAFLPNCLQALRTQSYPSDRFEVIVSDNGSTDGSIELLQAEYPAVRALANGRNLGFAMGNNAAMRAAGGELFVLLNNDTAPLPGWLDGLVTVALGDPRAGMVTGRLRLFYDQLELTLASGTIVPYPHDSRELGIQVYGVDSGASGGVCQYLDGFYGWEYIPPGKRFRWTRGVAQLGVPIPPGPEVVTLKFSLAAARPDGAQVPAQVTLDGTVLADWMISGTEPSEFSLILPASSRSRARPVLQNAGSVIFRDGSGRDRGTVARNNEVFYETDAEQYGQVEEVFAGCGASLLIRKAMVEDVGGFDDDLFMYYEDTDLAWRARTRGWKVLYAPQAIVKHIHCGTSQEWSPAFIFYTDRNRLAMLFKNGTWSQIAAEWSKYLARALDRLRKLIEATILGKDRTPSAARARIELAVVRSLLVWLPALWRKRRHIQKTRTIAHAQLQHWFLKG